MTDTTMADATFLASLLTELRLPSVARNWRRIAESADRDGWPAQSIAALMEIEVAERASRRIQRHRDPSRSAARKNLRQLRFRRRPGVRKQQLLSLGAGGDWIRNGDNLLLFGQRHGQESRRYGGRLPCPHRRGESGCCSPGPSSQRLQTARRDLSLIDALEKLDKFDLIVLDDLSYVRKDQAETSVLFELIARHLRRAQHRHPLRQIRGVFSLEHRLSGRRRGLPRRWSDSVHPDDHRNEWRATAERSAAGRAAKEEQPHLV